MEFKLQTLLSKKHYWMPTVCLAWCQLFSAAHESAGLTRQERIEAWLCPIALRRKICVYIIQSILYLFWVLSSDIKAADINLQGQKLVLMDPVKVIIDGSCMQHHRDLSKRSTTVNTVDNHNWLMHSRAWMQSRCFWGWKSLGFTLCISHLVGIWELGHTILAASNESLTLSLTQMEVGKGLRL